MKTDTLPLFEMRGAPQQLAITAPDRRALEDVAFPFEHIGEIAKLESWRKEVNRPTYHVHKWWAQRLGSVFRAILLGAFTDRSQDLLGLFYSRAKLPDAVIFDPFMGSGTTIGEALKLGARAIGRDINPVASFLVETALRLPPRDRLVATFRSIQHDVAEKIGHFYEAHLPDGRIGQTLYYFWVKVLSCPGCSGQVPLFSTYVFSRHAYASRVPEARALCPACGAVHTVRHDADVADCPACGRRYNPQAGPAHGTKATCGSCDTVFLISREARAQKAPPAHRLYAKLVLLSGGRKVYLPADSFDLSLYREACEALAARRDAYPVVAIREGHNTNQALGYNYKYWHQMFNERQLLCLSMLADRIKAIPDEAERHAFACLFSGTLEFNNMFASFKGEGTGAVRHMFAHHILKPERTPLEANPWGTPRSSGSFSTLFESRILRAVDYAERPFEVSVTRKAGKIAGEKMFGLSTPVFARRPVRTFAEFRRGADVYVSCGDSSDTDIETGSVDAVVTDPPFFDNVHYSELADFFFVWQRHILGARVGAQATTRSLGEVQHREPAEFGARLTRVWRECHRVLRDDGLLAFTYHHSRSEGWECVLSSLVEAGFEAVRAHPIKAEMAVAAPKQQAREPIDLDVILVCHKRTREVPSVTRVDGAFIRALAVAQEQIERLRRVGQRLSRGDLRVILTAQVVCQLSQVYAVDDAQGAFRAFAPLVDDAIERLGSRRADGDVAQPEHRA